MTKFIYNPSPIYTRLFKGGSVEIKAKSYISVQDWEVDTVYSPEIISKQVEVYAKVSDIPTLTLPDSETIVVVSKPPVVVGLTEDELKAELELKDKSPKPERGTGSVTQIGQPITEVTSSTVVVTTGEDGPEVSNTETEAAIKPKRGPKAKAKADVE